jgi:hypothetical protein
MMIIHPDTALLVSAVLLVGMLGAVALMMF